MKKFLLLNIILLSLSCNKGDLSENNAVTKNPKIVNENLTLENYLPKDYQNQIGKVVEAINYGLTNAPLIEERKTNRNGINEISSIKIDFFEAERLALKRLGLDYMYVDRRTNRTVFTNNSKMSDKGMEQLNKLISKNITNYSNRILELYSLFEDKNKSWNNKEEVISDLISKINHIEKEILTDKSLENWEKTALLTSSTTAKNFTSSFIVLAERVADKGYTKRFFSDLWDGITTVVRATVKVVSSAIITVARTVGYAVYSGAVRMFSSNSLGEAAFAGAGCAAIGAVQGFFGGIRNSFRCYNNYSLDCMMQDEIYSDCVPAF